MKRVYFVLISLLIWANGYAQELSSFKEDGKYGFRDSNGKTVIPAIYKWAKEFSEDLAAVTLDNKMGYIDKNGNVVIPLKYTYAHDFSEGLAAVELDNKYGFIDKNGNVVIPLKYTNARGFSEGLAVVELDNKYGFIDKSGNVVIQPRYIHAYDFSGGWAKVELLRVDGREKWVYVDKTGELEYTSLKMKPIWENLLRFHIKQINNYRLSPVNYGSFEIKRPYLLVSAESDQREDISFVRYSGNTFNEQSVDSIKFLVVKYDYLYEENIYRTSGVGTQSIKIESYGSYLIYFDVEKKRCIGFDKMNGPDLPLLVNETPYSTIQTRRVLYADEIIKKIETRVKSD